MADVQFEKQVNDIALKYAELLKNRIGLHSLYVYGSYASGQYTEDSDIDIAVVADGFTGDPVEDMFHLMKLRRSVDNRIEPHPFAVEDFTENNPMAEEIMRTGMRIV